MSTEYSLNFLGFQKLAITPKLTLLLPFLHAIVPESFDMDKCKE